MTTDVPAWAIRLAKSGPSSLRIAPRPTRKENVLREWQVFDKERTRKLAKKALRNLKSGSIVAIPIKNVSS